MPCINGRAEKLLDFAQPLRSYALGLADRRDDIANFLQHVLPGGGINFMVDVGKMKWRSFTWVAVPAVVAPVEYTMEKSTFIEMGGHQQAVRLLSNIKAEETAKWGKRKNRREE